MIPTRYGNTSGGTPVVFRRRVLAAPGYALSRRAGSDLLALLDVDLFTAGLKGLDLDDRASLCIREALEAFRRGLYLSCVTLLGSVSEGAWWRLAERLRGEDASLDKVLDDDRTSAAALIKTAAETVGRRKGMKTSASELHAHATYLRELRNYGIHPRGADVEAERGARVHRGRLRPAPVVDPPLPRAARSGAVTAEVTSPPAPR